MADQAHTEELVDPTMVLPRAPSEEAWAGMSPEERQRVVDALPSIEPQLRRNHSDVLMRDICRDEQGWHLSIDAAPIPTPAEVVAELKVRLQALEERAQTAERRLAEALAEIERLRRRL